MCSAICFVRLLEKVISFWGLQLPGLLALFPWQGASPLHPHFYNAEREICLLLTDGAISPISSWPSGIGHIRNWRVISRRYRCLSYARLPRWASSHSVLLVVRSPGLSLQRSGVVYCAACRVGHLLLRTTHRDRPSVTPPNYEYFRVHHST